MGGPYRASGGAEQGRGEGRSREEGRVGGGAMGRALRERATESGSCGSHELCGKKGGQGRARMLFAQTQVDLLTKTHTHTQGR